MLLGNKAIRRGRLVQEYGCLHTLRPGATVANTVQQMAAKTTQWNYLLAKAYMQNVPQGVRDDLARAYRRLPTVADDTRRYAQRVLDGSRDVQPYRTLGLLTKTDADRVANLTGQNVQGYDFTLDASAIQHINRQHGNVGSEAARGQRAVTGEDYAKLPVVLNDPDMIQDAGTARASQRRLVRWIKDMDGERWIVTQEIRTGRRSIVPITMYIR